MGMRSSSGTQRCRMWADPSLRLPTSMASRLKPKGGLPPSAPNSWTLWDKPRLTSSDRSSRNFAFAQSMADSKKRPLMPSGMVSSRAWMVKPRRRRSAL